MNIKKEHTTEDAVNEVKRLSLTYSDDMKDFCHLSTFEFFQWLAQFPYRKDPPGIEYMMRPSLIIQRGSCDCDEKTILALAWGKCKGLKGGCSIVSKSFFKPYHHIFPFFYDASGKRIDFDATYSHFKINDKRAYGKRKNYEVLT